jgi:hypothetical protein
MILNKINKIQFDPSEALLWKQNIWNKLDNPVFKQVIP